MIRSSEYGFVGVVVDTTNLEGSIWTWWREGGKFHIEKTATIPPEPAAKDELPPLLQGFGAVPPLVTDIDLSLDDKFLYVACWGTGEMRQYDVADPTQAEACRLGAYRRHRAAHAAPERQGASPAVRRWSRSAATASGSTGPTRSIRPGTTSSIPTACPARDGHGRCRSRTAGSSWHKDYWVEFPEGYRAHQIRLEGGDCSTDSFCYPSV